MSDSGRTPSAGSRLMWVDVAKACCSVLVVLYHIASKVLPDHEWASLATGSSPWQPFLRGAAPVLMPLFFTLSGFVASRSIRRPWRRVLRDRVVTPYYLYVVWFIIQSACFAVLLGLPTVRPIGVGGFALNAVLGTTTLWYLYSLAAFFVIAKALAWAPKALTLGAAALLAVCASAHLLPHVGDSDSVASTCVYFLAAAYLPGIVRHAAAAPTRVVIVAAAGFALVTVIAEHADVDRLPGAQLGLSILAIWPAIAVIARLAHALPSMAGRVSVVGRRTLVIYVVHMPLLGLLFVLGRRLTELRQLVNEHSLLALVVPAAMTVSVVVTCLLLQVVAERAGCGFLLRLPGSAAPRVRNRAEQWGDRRDLPRRVLGAIRLAGGVVVETQGSARSAHVPTDPGASHDRAALATAITALPID